MEAGEPVTEFTVMERAVLVKQAVPDLTVTAPLVNGVGNVTDTEVVPCPLLMTAPVGAVHV